MFTSSIIVTTPLTPSDEIVKNAISLAGKIGCRFCERGNNTIRVILERNNAEAAVVADLKSVRFVQDSHSYGFHPNMAMLRVDAIRAGRTDRYINIAGIEPGDKILDCTCGMGADAIVASYVAGDSGRVTALEASPVLAALVECGLRNYRHKKKKFLNESMKRIEVLNKDYSTVLREMETDSWDIVYFDPMFENTLSDANGLNLVRSLASYELPTIETVEEARRIAKKCVLVKDTAPGLLLKRMNIPVVSRSHKVWYGKIVVN